MPDIVRTNKQPRKISLHQPKFGLFFVVVLGASLAWPSLSQASASLFGGSAGFDSQQPGGPEQAHQPRSPQPPANGNSGPGNNRPPSQPGPTKGGEGGPQHGPSRPGSDQRPPETGGPEVKPRRPDSGPLHPPAHGHPPAHPAPRPPAHHSPHHRPRRPHYAWGYGGGWRLHQYFLGDSRTMYRMHRNYLFIGGYIPERLFDRIQPIPAGLMVDLPPVPPGYEIGYFDGYCLVYDPYSLEIIGLIDLYRY